MINFENKKVAVLGWGINGLDAARYLARRKAKITILDAKEKVDLDFSGFDIRHVDLRLGPNYLKKGLKNFDIIFRAPGVYRYLPQIVEAESSGVVITSAVREFFNTFDGTIIGVTGTKGKGTTSTLIYEILKESEKEVYLAGNIGSPILTLLSNLNKNSIVVLELSSFQLIDLNKGPHIAVVLNVTEDHLDWHKNRIEYVDAKKNIVRYLKDSDFAVINADYETPLSFVKEIKSLAMTYYFSTHRELPGCYIKNSTITLNWRDEITSVGVVGNLLLRGKHNWENVCAAVCASSLAGATIDSIKKTIYSFKGLEHRLELVDKVKSVTFYNDSFSTNPQTTIAAIYSFEEPLTIILGGSDKGLDYDEMGKEIAKAKNIRNVVLTGHIAGIIKKSLEVSRYSGKVVELKTKDMKAIVEKCFEITEKGGVVLLSPATASFDMFPNYKERGKEFKKAVKLLKD